MLMAERFGASQFYGFDNHPDSIEQARRLAAERGRTARVHFEVAEATDFPVRGYDVIAFFNCMHDVAHPDRCARHCRHALRPDGHILMVEPIGGDHIEDNFHPAGRLMSGSSVLCCTPHGMLDGGAALGPVFPDEHLARVIREAGFGTFRRVMTTRFSRVFEARP
jgi:SAM-dependent methyltransferase